jgi:EH domain-containing protein 1
MLAEDIARLMTMVPLEEKSARSEGKDKIEGGAFDGVLDKKTPFMYKGGEGVNAGLGEVEWVIEKDRMKYDEMFDKMSPIDGKISGAGAHFSFIWILYGHNFELK